MHINYKRFFTVIFVTVMSFTIISVSLAIGYSYINPNFLKSNSFIRNILSPITVHDKPINVILLGLDKVGDNTDVMVLAHYDPTNKKAEILSIPRDTRVKSNGKIHKINAIYQIGKKDLVKKVVGEVAGQNVDYVVAVKTNGFKDIIDTLGGVEVDVPMNMNYDDNDQNLHIHLLKGLQMLDGDKAEQFVRFRHGYKEGDLGRINADQIFFKALMAQKMKPEYILKAPEILNEVFKNLETDMPIEEAIKYALNAKDLKSENISFATLPGEPKYISGISYFIYNKDETQKLIENDFNNSANNQ
jgi:LCP family protein required for cell wall assembly